MEIKVNISRNKKDVESTIRMSFKTVLLKRYSINSRSNKVWLLACVLLSLAIGLYDKIMFVEILQKTLIYLAATIIFMFLFLLFISKYMTAKSISNNPKLVTETEDLVFNEKGISQYSRDYQSQSSWSKFNRAVITKDMIYLYPDTITSYFYPKHNFTDQQYRDVSDLIRKNIPDTKG